MNRLRKIGQAIARILLALSALSACWTGAYFATKWGFARLDWQPQALPGLLINSLLGFIFLVMLIAVVARISRKRDYNIHVEITSALRRISRGDFQVQLVKNEGPFGQLAEDINDMALNLKAMEEMRQEFISNVSHEIQSPLTSISGFARAMISEELKREDQLQYLGIIDAESTRLSKLSDDLLRLASLDSEHHPFHPEACRLDKQLQQQILACEPQWLNKELDMQVNLAETTIEADPSLLSQVWVNLLHNAIKFTSQGARISVSLEQQEEHAVVRITDTGIGMSEEDQKRIFERFFKADRSRSRSAGGSGLGLSIVHKIVEMHRGKINVSSKLDEGTVFTVTLPIIQR